MAEHHVSPTRVLHQCKHCGLSFYPKRTDRLMFCSRECSFAHKHANRASEDELHRRLIARQDARRKVCEPVPCNQCSTLFVPKTSKHGLCSLACQSIWRQKYHLSLARIKDARDRDPRSCAECGKLFVPEYGNKRRKFCSEDCGYTAAKRTSRKVGKLRKRVATIEPVNATKVFDRDGWRCQLCKCFTPRKHRGTYHPRAPELDHIVPLAAGGEHSYRNTQCTCRKCNSAKGSKPLGQLRLMA